jgi:hypothetical protein
MEKRKKCKVVVFDDNEIYEIFSIMPNLKGRIDFLLINHMATEIWHKHLITVDSSHIIPIDDEN